MRIFKGLSKQALVSFAATFCVGVVVAFIIINQFSKDEALKLNQLASSKSFQINDEISKLLGKVHIIAATVAQTNGDLENFEKLIAPIYDSPLIKNFTLAPGGIVSFAYPILGNENLIGMDFFDLNKGNKEAIKARETGRFVFGGPFEDINGEKYISGRLPVYLDDENGKRRFWGIASIALHYPDIFDKFNLYELNSEGYDYEISHVSPDSKELEVLISSFDGDKDESSVVEVSFTIQNNQWVLRIASNKAWYLRLEIWGTVIALFVVSILVTFVVQMIYQSAKLEISIAEKNTLNKMKEHLERVISTAPVGYLSSQDGIVTDANSFLKDKWGVLVGSKVVDYYTNPQDRQDILKELEHKDTVYNKIVSFKMKSGENRRQLINMSKVVVDNKLSYFLWTVDLEEMEKQKEYEQRQLVKTILSSIEYASKIQRNLLPHENLFRQSFSDYSIIWSPRDIVGGDIYWAKSYDEGTVLCVCDCTGHGTPGALLTMLVASAFEAVVNDNNYRDTAEIVWQLENRLVNVFSVNSRIENKNDSIDIKDGCDLAVLYISKDKSVTISSAKTHVFICDGNEVTQMKGQKLFIGEGKLKSKDDVNMVTIPANSDNKFYIASDGLYDQMGESNRKFGYKTFKQLILENHSKKQAAMTCIIWEAFESHRGKQARRDDIELITFKP